MIHDCTGMDVTSGTNNTSSVIVKKEPVFEAECSEYESFMHDPKGLEEVDVDLEDLFEENSGATGRKEPIKGIRSYEDTRSEERIGKRKNPTDSYGKVTTCNLCGSVYHWVRDCPERESYEEEGIKFFSNEIQREYLPIFLKETLN